MIAVTKNSSLGKWTLLVAVLFFLLVVESGFFGRLAFLPVIPQLLVVFLAGLFTLSEGNRYRDVFVTAIIAGVFLDFSSGLPDGVFLLALLASLGLLLAISRWFLSIKASFRAAFALNVILLTALNFGAVGFFSKLLALVHVGTFVDWGFLSVRRLGWLLIVNLILAYPIMLALRSFGKRLLAETKNA